MATTKIRGPRVSQVMGNAKGWSPEQSIQKARERVDKIGAPKFKIDFQANEEIQLPSLHQCTNVQLEELLSLVGSWRAYLEVELSKTEAERGVIEATFEEGLSKQLYRLSQKYREDGAKKPNMQELRGEAVSSSTKLIHLKTQLIDLESQFIRVQGVRNQYKFYFDAISRVVAVRSTSRDQV